MTTTLLGLLLLTADAPRIAPRADVERTYDLAELPPADAARLQGRRARFRVVLDSDEAELGKYTTVDCLAPDGLAGGVWLLPGRELRDEMTVEATLRIINHRAAWGFPALREYRLMDAVVCRP